jgi:hypothetical protein
VVVVLGATVEVVAPDVVVVAPVVVVVVGLSPATAMTGEIGAAVGVDVVMPEGVTESFGYAVHVSARALPATSSDRLAEESSCMVIWLLVDVNGPTVSGDEGSDRLTPVSGIGLGKGTLKSRGPTAKVAGVAPVASI